MCRGAQLKMKFHWARILLATACPGSPALWAGSFTFYGIINLKKGKSRMITKTENLKADLIIVGGGGGPAPVFGLPIMSVSSA